MAEVVNLRLVRKRKQREVAEAAAQVNRAAHGRTKIERLLSEDEAARAARHLDAHRREPGT